MRAVDTIKSFRVNKFSVEFVKNQISLTTLRCVCVVQDTRMSALRPPAEFFDHNRISRPADLNQAVSVRRVAILLGRKEFVN